MLLLIKEKDYLPVVLPRQTHSITVVKWVLFTLFISTAQQVLLFWVQMVNLRWIGVYLLKWVPDHMPPTQTLLVHWHLTDVSKKESTAT